MSTMKSSSSILVAACLAGASAESQKGYQRQTSYAGQQLLDCQKTASLPWDQLDLWQSYAINCRSTIYSYQ